MLTHVAGGFELGGTSMWVTSSSGAFTTLNTAFCRYDGGVIVKRSIELGEPIVYVSMNYR